MANAAVCLPTGDLPQADKTPMKFYAYALVSLKNNDIYIGSTEDLDNRIRLHNKGKIKSTKSNRPWKLLEYHKFNTRSEAFKYEKFLKNHQQKEVLKRK